MFRARAAIGGRDKRDTDNNERRASERDGDGDRTQCDLETNVRREESEVWTDESITARRTKSDTASHREEENAHQC